MERLFRHMFWADEQVVELLTTPKMAVPDEARRLLAHLFAAERVWLLRVQGRDAGAQPIWPDTPLDELEGMRAANRSAWEQLVASLTDAELEREVEYANSAGTVFRNRVADMLLQVALHGSYHRGQIAAAVRRAGGEPVNTDYIAWQRSQS